MRAGNEPCKKQPEKTRLFTDAIFSGCFYRAKPTTEQPTGCEVVQGEGLEGGEAHDRAADRLRGSAGRKGEEECRKNGGKK